jgi:precorrin-6B methylase 1
MKQKFTPNHLVKYLYNENTASERLAIDEALTYDANLQEEYNELKAAHQQLSKVRFSPSSSSIQNILKYSRSTALEKHV